MSATSTAERSNRNGTSLKDRIKRNLGACARKRSRKRSRKPRELVIDNDEKCTGREIERSLAIRFGLSESAARDIWRAILDHMRNALLQGRAVSLTNISTVEPYVKKAHTYRHPTTGEMCEAPERWHVRLIVSPGLQEDLQFDHS